MTPKSIDVEIVSKQIDDNENAFFEQEIPYKQYLQEKEMRERSELNNKAFEHIQANQGTCGTRNCIYCDIYRSAMMEIDGSR